MTERIKTISGVVYEVGDQMDIRTVTGHLLQEGNQLPRTKGTWRDPRSHLDYEVNVNSIPGVKIVSVLNLAGTEICDMQTARMEAFHLDHPEITVLSVSKQDPKELARFARKHGITHPLISVDNETARKLSAELKPQPGSNPDWKNMLLREVLVVTDEGALAVVDLNPNQMRHPSYKTIFDAAELIHSNAQFSAKS